MASLIRPPSTLYLQPKINLIGSSHVVMNLPFKDNQRRLRASSHRELSFTVRAKSVVEEVANTQPSSNTEQNDYGVVGVHHVGILCENLEKSLHFYRNILGLKINEARPHDKLPYRGAWLWVGSEMIHLMELPNPDPLTGRPEHGGRDRHTCIAISAVSKLKVIFDEASIPYTLSRSGRPAIFARDPDGNALEFTQVDSFT